MHELVNLTPHDVVIIQNGEVVSRISPSGRVARVSEQSISSGEINGIPLVKKQYGAVEVLSRDDFLKKVPNPEIEDLPIEQDGALLIVPMLVGQVLSGKRVDLIGPDFGIGGSARSKDGSITGASGFIKY